MGTYQDVARQEDDFAVPAPDAPGAPVRPADARPGATAAKQGQAVPPTHATAIMLAAANYYWHEVLSVINARREAPCRAATPEPGLDIAAIHREALHVKRWAIWCDLFIGMVALAAVFFGVRLFMPATDDMVGMPEQRHDALYLVLAWLAMVAADFGGRRRAMAAVRRHLRSCADCSAAPCDCCEADERNVTVSGGYMPFVGAGQNVGGWSFTVNLTQPEKENVPVQPATVAALYEETGQAMARLGIAGMAVRDELFVDGRDVRMLGFLTPDGAFQRPRVQVDGQRMAHFIDNNDPAARHYKVIRLQLWGGQVVLSNLYRYVIQGGTLYVEARSLVLPPLNEKYLALQNLPQAPLPGEVAREIFLSLLRGMVVWIPALLRTVPLVMEGFAEHMGYGDRRRHKANCREIAENQLYNYGWSKSLREIWAGGSYSRYFQMMDKDFYGKVIGETLLASLLKSLERRNISTSGLKEASTRIYNEGVMISGGTVQADSIAAGKGARAQADHSVRTAQGGPAA